MPEETNAFFTMARCTFSWRDPAMKEKLGEGRPTERNIRIVPACTDFWGSHDEPSWDSEEESVIFTNMAERLATQVGVDKRENCGPMKRSHTRNRFNILESRMSKKRHNPPVVQKRNSSAVRNDKS